MLCSARQKAATTTISIFCKEALTHQKFDLNLQKQKLEKWPHQKVAQNVDASIDVIETHDWLNA